MSFTFVRWSSTIRTDGTTIEADDRMRFDAIDFMLTNC